MFLERERAAAERFLPGLDKELADYPLMELERPGGPALRKFRDAGGPGLLIPAEHGGGGAGARDAVACTRLLGSRAPSLAVGATMHNFSIASLVGLTENSDGMEWMLLDGIARDGLLVSSAFAEGKTGQGVMAPSIQARRDGAEWVVSGRKKPCSLSQSMDLITASVSLVDPDGGEPVFGVALIPANTPGVRTERFWNSIVLTGAESDELILDDVRVSEDLVIRPELDPGSNLDDLQTVGLIWFSLLVAASYLGVASALVQRVIDADKGGAQARVPWITELEGATLALDRVASAVDGGETGNDTLADALVARYLAQGSIRRTVDACVEILGGIGFVSSPDISYLAAASHAVQFHPPSRRASLDSFDTYFAGGTLRID